MASKAKKQPKPELPTPEQTIKGVYVEELMSATAGAPTRLRRKDSDELDRQLFNGWLTMDQHVTLERFRGELYRAGMVFCPRAGAEVAGASGQGAFLADVTFHRARKVAVQMEALAEALSRSELNTLIGMLTMDEPMPKSHGYITAKAVSVLDKLYGVK